MENTLTKIRSLGLPESFLTKLTSLLLKETFPKGHILIKEGRIEKAIYFLEEGIARAFVQKEEKEVTFWFGAEGEILLSLNSYFAHKPGYESIEMLEKSVVYKITHESLYDLYNNDIEFANWGRRLAEYEFLKADQRFIDHQFKTAATRYEEFITANPSLLQRIQLGHIASYLGISQVTLSRIRAEKN